MSRPRSSRVATALLGAVVALAMPAALAAQELVVNGGFESSTSGSLGAPWSVVFGPNATCFTGADPQVARTGTYGLFTGPVGGSCTIQQVLATTIGADYTFSFWLRNPNAATPNAFTARWGASTLLSFSNAPVSGWTEWSFGVTATEAQTTISFVTRHEDGFFYMDDVSVRPTTVVPEPSAMWLLLTGGSLLAGVAWRRRPQDRALRHG